MPFPCRWIRGRDLSHCPGLSCRSGRVVPMATKLGQVVSVTLLIKEQENEAGKCSTALILRCLLDLSLFSS